MLTHRREDGRDTPLLVWRFDQSLRAVTSGPLGGGIGVRNWVVNATVSMSYWRDDPDVHLAELADQFDLRGPGVGLLTGVDVAEVVTRTDTGVRVWATVGLGAPIWAAAEPLSPPVAERVGTVNIVAFVPVQLSDAALVNAVATLTEAKAQAIWELGLSATGTATDSVTVLCPPDGAPAQYGGPRSQWGAPLARAGYQAVRDGGSVPCVPWSVRVER
jgi:adenosylcobinamide amidohydrolase